MRNEELGMRKGMTSFEMLVGRIQATSEALQQDALVVINRNVTEGRVAA